MKRIFILLLFLSFSYTASYGQGGLIRGLFYNNVGGDDAVSVKSLEYAYYPLVNQSSIRLNWRSGRFVFDEAFISNELQVDFLALTWMFPNSLKKDSWGSIGTSIVTFTHRLGTYRIKPFVNAELLGIATCSESLGEKLPMIDTGTKRKFVFYSSVSAGLDCYLGTHSMIKVSAGILDRCLIIGNYLYPFGSVSLVYEITGDPDTYRSAHRLQ